VKPDDAVSLRRGSLGAPPLTALAAMGAVWGPGLLVMLADTDAGNIITAADAGARWGYRLLPLPLLLIPALAMVQDLAVRIGIFTGRGFGDLIRERLGRPWRWLAAVALTIATLGSLITDLTGVAGVGELYGIARPATLGLAGLCLLLVMLTGKYRRVEQIALLLGLFEFSFFVVAWDAHPAGAALARDLSDQRFTDSSYLYLAAGLIGATFNPWMVFYQASALAEKRLTPAHYPAARWDTLAGAILTQLLTAAVLLAVGAVSARNGSAVPLDSVGRISDALTPTLGMTVGRLAFGIGVTGAAMAAAIVCSLACAWGLGEIFGIRRSADQDATREPWFRAGYTACILGGAAVVLFVPDLVGLSVATQVLNAALLPVIGAILVVLAATALPGGSRLRGSPLWLTAATVGLVAAAGLVGAIASLS